MAPSRKPLELLLLIAAALTFLLDCSVIRVQAQTDQLPVKPSIYENDEHPEDEWDGMSRQQRQDFTEGFDYTLWYFGNSFTVRNTFGRRVMKMWQQLDRDKQGRISTPRHTHGGANIASHWQWMASDNALAEETSWGRVTWVILQDQSISPAIPQWRMMSGYYLRNLMEYIPSHVPLLMWSTWGYRGGYSGNGVSYDTLEQSQALLDGYKYYKQALDGTGRDVRIAPCGETFAVIYRDCVAHGVNPLSDDCLFFTLHDRGDGYHPSAYGSHACAMTVAVTMTGGNPWDTYEKPFDGEMVGGQLVEDIIRDAVARSILGTYNSGELDYPFDIDWGNRDDWRNPTDPPAPTDPPTRMPTPNPTTLAPTQAPTIAPTAFFSFDAVFVGTSSVLANQNAVNQFTNVLQQMVPKAVLGPGPVSVAKTEIDSLETMPLTLPADLPTGFDTQQVDWFVFQEPYDLASQPDYTKQTAAIVAGGARTMTDPLGANSMFLMTFGPLNNGDMTSQTAALWDGYMTYVNQTSNLDGYPNHTAYLAPAGLVAQTIYQDYLDANMDPLADGTLFHQLYADDGVNPSRAGTYLIAVTLSSSISGVDPLDLTWVPSDDDGSNALDAQVAAGIRSAVSRTIMFTAASGLVYPWKPVVTATDDDIIDDDDDAAFDDDDDDMMDDMFGDDDGDDTLDDDDDDDDAIQLSGTSTTSLSVNIAKSATSPNNEKKQSVPAESHGESPDMEEVLGLTSGTSAAWLWQGTLFLGQVAAVWMLL